MTKGVIKINKCLGIINLFIATHLDTVVIMSEWRNISLLDELTGERNLIGCFVKYKFMTSQRRSIAFQPDSNKYICIKPSYKNNNT